MSECKKCKAPVIFAKTIKGKWAIFDEAPIGDGLRYRLTPQPGAPPLATREEYAVGHASHWATCPNAEDFRKPKQQDLFSDE